MSNCTPITPAWIVYAWAPILWQASSADSRRFAHLGTRVLTFGDETNPCTGQTLWGDPSVNQPYGIAWDWVEIQDGVVAMADPFGMVTNLRLLDAHGALFDDRQITVQLYQLVHTLPWQIEVQRVLHKPFGSPKYLRTSEQDESVVNESNFRPHAHLLQRAPSSNGLNLRRAEGRGNPEYPQLQPSQITLRETAAPNHFRFDRRAPGRIRAL